MRYFDLLIERKKNRDKYLNNMDYYLKIIKEFFKKELGDVEIYPRFTMSGILSL